MKKYLTKEQSKELIDLGIDPKHASMVCVRMTHDSNGNPVDYKEYMRLAPFEEFVIGFESFDVQPIFTFGDLYELMPKNIRMAFPLSPKDGVEDIDILFEHIKLYNQLQL